jgi:glutathione peroxidase
VLHHDQHPGGFEHLRRRHRRRRRQPRHAGRGERRRHEPGEPRRVPGPERDVNVASSCGYTPQYEGLQAIYAKYAAQGFTVLGFPCNQFGSQESGSAETIRDFCSSTYKVTFPLFEKVDVNGANVHPVYQWLKSQPGATGDVAWNFTKFLVGRDGKVAKRWGSQVEPEDARITAEIEAALAK